jgi:hypothetical protein
MARDVTDNLRTYGPIKGSFRVTFLVTEKHHCFHTLQGNEIHLCLANLESIVTPNQSIVLFTIILTQRTECLLKRDIKE